MTEKKRQRLVLSNRKVDASVHIFTYEELKSLVKRGEEFELPSRTQFHVSPLDSDEDIPVRIWAELPPKAPKVAMGKVIKIKRLTNLQLKVQEQVKNRQEAVKNGTARGYVPPVNGRKRKSRKRKPAGQ